MTLKQARLTRDNYQFLLGRKAKEGDSTIYDVIVVPNDNYADFLEDYRTNMDEASNDEMLLEHPSSSYSVKVVYDTDPEFVDLYLDDISMYKDEVANDEDFEDFEDEDFESDEDLEDDEDFDDDENNFETDNADIVWDAIIESAKTRFDYRSFAEPFDKVSPHIADNLLFKVIIELVNKEKPSIIAAKLRAEVMMLGLMWNDVEQFVENKNNELKAELFATQIAYSLLEEGNPPIHVLSSIRELLN